MRGRRNPQSTMPAFVNLDERGPTGPSTQDHHARRRRCTRPHVQRLHLDVLQGRWAPVPAERLPKALLLEALYSMPSERAFC